MEPLNAVKDVTNELCAVSSTPYNGLNCNKEIILGMV